jgi:hypothetical protein
VVNITTQLQTLNLQELGQLRQEQYSNLTTDRDGSPSVLRDSIASRLLLAVARSDDEVARMIHEAVTHQRPFPVCLLSKRQVEAWIRVHRPALQR